MIREENETKEVAVIKDVLCNKCGVSCLCHTTCGFSYASLNVHWGYGSTRDMEVHEAQLCQNCWEEIIKTFKYPDLVADNIL